mgnify:CR=1 FL=1
MNHLKSMIIMGLTIGSTAAYGGTITVSPKQNLRNSTGFFRCSLWLQGDGFPVDYEKSTQRVSAPISGARASCTFENVQPGKYAISVLHDENDNKRMDATERGAPKEGFGFSNNAFPQGRQTPSFESAAFEYDGSNSTIALEIRYLPAG